MDQLNSEQIYQDYIQLKAFARQDGLFMGLLWLVSFGCFVASQSQPILSFLFDFTIVSIPFFAASRVKVFRDGVLDGYISFRRAYFFLLLVFIYATLILALGQWAYFEFIDNGRLIEGMIKTINSPEFQPVIEAYNISKADLDANMQTIAEARPIDFAFTFIWLNTIAGVILSWVIALFTKRTKKQ